MYKNVTKIKRNKGFTLIELLVVVGIVGITLGIGLPSFQAAITSNRLTTSANEMVLALQSARSESIKKVKFVGVSIAADGLSWFTFVENSSDPTKLLQHYSAAKNVTLEITSDGLYDDTPTYRSDGRLASNTPIVMEFTVEGSTEKRTLTIEPSGRVSVVSS